jgi:hypothetical protein
MTATGATGIRRGDRMFVRLAAVGECDASGKVVLSCQYKSKAVAEPDRPLVLVIGLAETIVEMARYTSVEALEKDLDGLKAYVATLERRVQDGRGDGAGEDGDENSDINAEVLP